MGELSLTDLRKEFDNGNVIAVEGLDLDISDGEFVTLVGPSGCGKTTTLRMIAGLERPTSGSIRLDGTDVTRENPRDRDIAMVFQDFALYPHKTVRANMAFGLRMSTDMSKDERNQKVESVAEMMGIEDLLDDKPDQISGGQKQRVALGRAIVREPEVFLFDEPLSNLDAKLRTEMRTEIQQLQKELDITSIYVTHDQEEAMTMGDRIVVLDDGRLQQVGSPTEVYEHPTNRFVAGFIGSPSMNFLDVELAVASEQPVLQTNDGSLRYSVSDRYADQIRQNTKEGALTLGIRPEALTVAASPGDHTTRATAEVIEPIGSDNYLYLDLSSGTSGTEIDVDDANQFTARVDAGTHPEEDETVHIEFAESDIHLFDRETGESVLSDRPTANAAAKSNSSESTV